MKRTIVKIDEKRCNGCGLCVTGCHEGALQMIDGKAVMVSEIYCDGLGACIPECPQGAISLEEREAEAYDEIAVMELSSLRKKAVNPAPVAGLQPGSTDVRFVPPGPQPVQFPVQLHLLNPMSKIFAGADVLLAADCTAYAAAGFHSRFLTDKVLAIACPKLDSNREAYVEKLVMMMESSGIETLTVIIMEVPCCSGLMELVRLARERSARYVPVKKIVLTTGGALKSEIWVQ
ncbi:MAG: 4Fe-4S dicluster domain-containing protein [Bacteroidales bacterium]|jgi:NAD-dependent dihydropyrimidine dehydrogenase PreA subunit|nr:4Fe-4S binding protein [Bacteroidales bacterium]